MRKGSHVTEETKARISLANMGNRSGLGTHWSEEAKTRHTGHIPWNKGIKGQQVAWNKGKKMTDEHKRMGPLSNGWKGGKVERTCPQCDEKFQCYPSSTQKYCNPECYFAAKKGHFNHAQSLETRKKLSDNRRGQIMPKVTRLAIRKANLGSHRSEEAREKTAAKLRGRTHPGHPSKKGIESPNWKGGPGLSAVRKLAKRRDLGFLCLTAPLPEACDGHHLDHDHIVFIPRALHQSIGHDHNTGRGMERINALALAYAGLTADVLDDTLPFD